jgi:hypothetical protein
MRDIICGQKRLNKLRKRTRDETVRALAVTGVPFTAFVYMWAYTEGDEVLTWLRPLDAWDPGQKTLHVAAKRACQAMSRGALWLFFPAAVALSKMKRWGAAVFHRGPVYSIGLLLALSLTVVATICAGVYVRYMYKTLHFRYKVLTQSEPCVSEDLTPEDLKRLGPGLAKTKASHLEAVLNYLRDFSKGSSGSSDEAKVHVRVAARNILAKTSAWKKMYTIANWSLLVLMSLVSLACAALLAPILRTAKTDPKWLIKCPAVIFGTAIAALVVSSMAVVIKQRAQQEDKMVTDFVTLASSFLTCKDSEKCRAVAGQFKTVPTHLSSLPGGRSNTYSLKVLAATTAVATLGFLYAFVAASKPVQVARGIRALQSREMRTFLKFDGSSMSGGSALVGASEFRDRMKNISDLIGEVPRSHVALWSMLVSMVSGCILYTAWRDVLQSVHL